MKEFSKSRQKKYDYWQGIMRDWKNSGLIQTNYCASHHISFSTFKNWRTRLAKKNENHESEIGKSELSNRTNRFPCPEMVPVKISQGIDLHNSFNADTHQSSQLNNHQVRIELKSGIMIYIPTGD